MVPDRVSHRLFNARDSTPTSPGSSSSKRISKLPLLMEIAASLMAWRGLVSRFTRNTVATSTTGTTINTTHSNRELKRMLVEFTAPTLFNSSTPPPPIGSPTAKIRPASGIFAWLVEKDWPDSTVSISSLKPISRDCTSRFPSGEFIWTIFPSWLTINMVASAASIKEAHTRSKASSFRLPWFHSATSCRKSTTFASISSSLMSA